MVGVKARGEKERKLGSKGGGRQMGEVRGRWKGGEVLED